MSVPFFGKEFTFTQPDGSQLQVRGFGDQHQAVFETLDGFTVAKDPVSGFFHYAQVIVGELGEDSKGPCQRRLIRGHSAFAGICAPAGQRRRALTKAELRVLHGKGARWERASRGIAQGFGRGHGGTRCSSPRHPAARR